MGNLDEEGKTIEPTDNAFQTSIKNKLAEVSSTMISQKIVHSGPLLAIRFVPKEVELKNSQAEQEAAWDNNKNRLELEDKIYINEIPYVIYGIVYKIGRHYTCCVRESGTDDWMYLDDSKTPRKIEGRVPEIYRNIIEFCFYCRESHMNCGFQ